MKKPEVGAHVQKSGSGNWYRQVFLELAKEADCITYNCTEGGTLFGDPIIFTPLAEFLSKFSCTKKGENNG